MMNQVSSENSKTHFFQQSLISEDFTQVTEAELRDLVFVMRKKLVRRDAII